tara:strand:- start:2553 stop:2807 length:255 start_codon:yes stop_codon:yes gene_type:complete
MKNYIYVIVLSLSVLTLNASTELDKEPLCQPLYQKTNTIEGHNLGKEFSNTYCCKICKKGKACGDSCINKNYTCRKPAGCACNG